MAMVTCVLCGDPVATGSKNSAQRVEGWVSPRQGGGANHIRYQTKTSDWAHVACLAEQEDPVHANQDSMF